MNVLKLDPNAIIPTRSHSVDAGLDLYSLEDRFIPIGQSAFFKTGIALGIPEGHYGQIAGRSSLNKAGLVTAPGIVDSGYQGDISIILHNFSASDGSSDFYHSTASQGYHIKKGDRIAQILILPMKVLTPVEVTDLGPSDRGSKGFGSSGK